MDAYDRTDLHDKIMVLLRGRIQMGAGRRKRKAPVRKRAPVRRRVARRRAGDEAFDEAYGSGEGRRRRRVGRPRVHRRAGVETLSMLGMGECACGGEGRRRVRRRRAGEGEGEGRRRVRRRRAGVSAEGEGEGRRRVRHRRAGVSAGKVTSPWIKHVKAYAKAHHMPYGEAMSKARASYRG